MAQTQKPQQEIDFKKEGCLFMEMRYIDGKAKPLLYTIITKVDSNEKIIEVFDETTKEILINKYKSKQVEYEIINHTIDNQLIKQTENIEYENKTEIDEHVKKGILPKSERLKQKENENKHLRQRLDNQEQILLALIDLSKKWATEEEYIQLHELLKSKN